MNQGREPEPGEREPGPRDPEHWPLLERERGPHLMVARVRFDTLRNPRTGQALKRTVLETPSWVNVVAYTPERELVVVRQYRFGSAEVTVEIPGGVVDPGEAHLAAAQRELREETGYTSESWTYLGFVTPNPAFLDNLCHSWLAEDCALTHATDPDPGEDIVVDRLAPERVLAMVAGGTISHGLVLNALCRVLDLSALPRPDPAAPRKSPPARS